MKVQYPLVISTLSQRFAMGAYCFGLIAAYVFGLEVDIPLLALVSIVCLGVGMSCSALHLGRPKRILNTFANPSSHLTREMFCVPLVGIPYVLVGCNGWLYTMPDAVTYVLQAIGFAASLLFIWVTAKAYQMPARPAWRGAGTTANFCLTFLAAGSVAAAAFMAATDVVVSVPYVGMMFALFLAAIMGQFSFIWQMGRVGYGAEVHPRDPEVAPTFRVWLAFGVAAPVVLGFAMLFVQASALVAATFAVYLVDIFLWQSFFFLCGRDVQFFPQYPEAPMNPNYF